MRTIDTYIIDTYIIDTDIIDTDMLSASIPVENSFQVRWNSVLIVFVGCVLFQSEYQLQTTAGKKWFCRNDYNWYLHSGLFSSFWPSMQYVSMSHTHTNPWLSAVNNSELLLLVSIDVIIVLATLDWTSQHKLIAMKLETMQQLPANNIVQLLLNNRSPDSTSNYLNQRRTRKLCWWDT